MKKLLTLLFFAALITSCGGGGDDNPVNPTPSVAQFGSPKTPIAASEWTGDWNDKTDPNYKKDGYNPLYGQWIVTHVNGVATTEYLVYYFDIGQSWKQCATKPAEGKAPEYDYKKNNGYLANNTSFKDEQGIIYKYQMATDRSSLLLFDGTTTLVFKPYDNNGVWRWRGDWNAKANPYYAIYNGKYNPIKGTWKLIKKGKYSYTGYNHTRFNDDFTLEEGSPNGKTLFDDKRKYAINDTGVKDYGTTRPFDYQYKIKGDTLFYGDPQTFAQTPSYTFVKVK